MLYQVGTDEININYRIKLGFLQHLSNPVHADKFVKTTSEDGSLIVKAPMHLKCLASYFDPENKVDGVKNHNVGLQ